MSIWCHVNPSDVDWLKIVPWIQLAKIHRVCDVWEQVHEHVDAVDSMELLTEEQRALFVHGGSIHDYDILKPIGKGKFSLVYKAKRKRDEMAVALKKIAIFDMMDARAREKTLKEVRLVQSVGHHPNIVQYLDAFIMEKELYIAFEWAEAGDLKRQIRKANEKGVRFDEKTIWRYFMQICDAILHLHRSRIMHRDMKPANIFLTCQGIVKVGDLGLGRHLSEDTMEAHSKVGTPLYMSPEVLRGEGYDWKSDVWSLGCILYELAMLRSPFKSEGLNLYGLFQKINKGEYEPVPAALYSRHLRQLVHQMLQLNANDRPSMEQVWHCCQTRPTSATLQTKAPAPSNQRAPSKRPVESTRPPEPEASPTSRPRSSSASSSSSTTQQKEDKPVDTEQQSHKHTAMRMELLYEKLVLLRYERALCGRRIPRNYFALDQTSTNTRQRHPSSQLDDVCAIAQWLLQAFLGATDDRNNETPSPVVRIQKLLIQAERCGIPSVRELQAPALACGHGEGVVVLMDAVADAALRSATCRLQTPSYPHETIEELAGDDAMEVTEDEHGESTASMTRFQDENDEDHDHNDRNWLLVRPETSPEALPMIHSAIDPVAWAKERQQMTPKLLERLQHERSVSSFASWCLHFDRLRRIHDGVLMPLQPLVSNQLDLLHKSRTRELNQLHRLETLVQTHQERSAIEHQKLTEQLQQRQRNAHATQTTINDLIKTLATIETTCQTKQSEVQAQQTRVNDTSCLLRLKERIGTLKDENHRLALELHLRRHQLDRFLIPNR